MNLKYSIQEGIQQIDFSVNPESGALIIEANGELNPIIVPHLVAIELIEVLRLKLYDHQQESESLFKRLFK
jgi:hypothetical protein